MVFRNPLDAIDPAARIQRMLADWRLVRLRVARVRHRRYARGHVRGFRLMIRLGLAHSAGDS